MTKLIIPKQDKQGYRQTESKIQQESWMWFNNNYCLKKHNPRCSMFSVPNELAMKIRGSLQYSGLLTKKISDIINICLKGMTNTGMKSGVSDTLVLLPGKVLFIEFKTSTGSQSDTQKQFESIVIGLGFKYYLCRSLEQFKEIIHAETPQP